MLPRELALELAGLPWGDVNKHFEPSNRPDTVEMDDLWEAFRRIAVSVRILLIHIPPPCRYRPTAME